MAKQLLGDLALSQGRLKVVTAVAHGLGAPEELGGEAADSVRAEVQLAEAQYDARLGGRR